MTAEQRAHVAFDLLRVHVDAQSSIALSSALNAIADRLQTCDALEVKVQSLKTRIERLEMMLEVISEAVDAERKKR